MQLFVPIAHEFKCVQCVFIMHVCIFNTLQAIGYYIAFTVPDPSNALPLVFVYSLRRTYTWCCFHFWNKEKARL